MDTEMRKEFTTILGAVWSAVPVANSLALEEVFAKCVGRYFGRPAPRSTEIMLLWEFLNSLDAVNCAVAIQRELTERSRTDLPTERRPLSIGVDHIGLANDDSAASHEQNDNIAKLVFLAEPGGICLSRTVYDEVRSHIDLVYDTERDPKQVAFLCQELRQKLGDLDLAGISVVRIGPAALALQSDGDSAAAGKGLVHKIKTLVGGQMFRSGY